MPPRVQLGDGAHGGRKDVLALAQPRQLATDVVVQVPDDAAQRVAVEERRFLGLKKINK